MSQPGPRTIHDDFELIEAYVTATFARYERVLITLIPALEEPRIVNQDLVFRRLHRFVETLAGFAVGAAVRAAAWTARRGFGEEVRVRVDLLLQRVARNGSTAVATSEDTPRARFLNDPRRPLLDALGSQLLERLCRSSPETRTHVSAIHAEIMRTAPKLLPAFADELARLTRDDAPALAFSDQLASGWRYFAAAVSARGLPRPAETDEDEQKLWHAWTRRLAGRPAPGALTQTDLRAEGFLLQVM